MQVSYQPWLVLLSIVIAIEGANIGLRLTLQLAAAVGIQRRMLLAGAAFALAVATWGMHFVAMLAARLPFPVDYLVFPTLLSFLICVLLIGAGVYAIGSGPPSPMRLVVSCCAMGAGIFMLHYIGMTALGSSAFISHTPGFAVGGLLITIAGCALALRLVTGRAKHPPLMRAAVIFGVAISAFHFTDMAGMTLNRQASLAEAPVLSSDLLAIIVAIVAFGVSGIFLLLHVPDRTEVNTESMIPPFAPPPLTENGLNDAEVAVSASGSGSDSDSRRGIYAPLGGAGAPPPRIAEHLPIERDGITQLVPVEEVIAVQANAHYTYLFDGSAKLFCPLAIGEVESRLDRNRFMRVHRSHIINIECVSGYKRSGDSEMVELGGESRYTVPVSRNRAGWLKSRIGEKNGEAGRRPASRTTT